MAHITADNGKYFTGEELTFKLQNLMANKELGDHIFYEGIEYEGHELSLIHICLIQLYIGYGKNNT